MSVIGGPNRIPHCRLFQILCIAGPSEGAYQRVTNFKVMRKALLECGKNTLKMFLISPLYNNSFSQDFSHFVFRIVQRI